MSRLISRNNLTTVEANTRINSQMPIEEKMEKSEFVVDNTGSIEKLEQNIDKVIKEITPMYIQTFTAWICGFWFVVWIFS